VANFQPRKNLERLVTAAARLPEVAQGELALVLIGTGSEDQARALRAAVAGGRATGLPAIQRRLGRSRLDTVVLAEALALGDELAAELVARAARALGTAIGSACNLVDVEGVLLGGGLTEVLGEPFVRRVERAIRPRLLANEPPLEVRRTSLGDMAGAIGADARRLSDVASFGPGNCSGPCYAITVFDPADVDCDEDEGEDESG
jgi:predicted NBD/HSP70 family sugar kinase